VQVNQTQDSTDHYSMPLRFQAIAGSDTIPVTLVNTVRSEFFRMSLPKKIDNLIFDTNAIIISRVSVQTDPSLATVGLEASKAGFLHAMFLDGSLQLTFSQTALNAEVTLFDVLGREVLRSDIVAGSSSLMLPASQLHAGTYVLRLRDGTNIQTAKIQIQ
jgi:hypothetical protein